MQKHDMVLAYGNLMLNAWVKGLETGNFPSMQFTGPSHDGI